MLNLRPYQEELVQSVVKSLEDGHKNTLVVASTGAGKTICFVEACNRLTPTLADDECILILSHLSLLTTQTKDKFTKFSDLDVGILQAQLRPDIKDKVVISTMQSSSNADKMVEYVIQTNKRPRYIIVDESHRRFSASYSRIFSFFKDAQVVDFTATPYKNRKLASGFYDNVAFQISMEDLISQGYLVRPVLHQIKSDVSESALKCSLVLRLYQEKEAGKNSIVFMSSKEECKLMCDVFNKQNIVAWAVTDEMSEAQREVVFDKYNKGEVQVLVSVDVLTAGFDAPICSSIFMFNTKSVVAYIQRAGRALRPYEGKLQANIYYIGDTPTIESGDIEKMHEQSVKPKKKEECKDFDELTEWLEDHDLVDTPEYHHSKEVRKACNLAKKMNMETLNRLLNTNKFPQKFTRQLINGLANARPATVDGIITPKQTNILAKHLGSEITNSLTRNEANAVISSLTGKYVNPTGNDAYIFQDGVHKGKHVKDVPWAYKSMVRRKFRNSKACKVINSWHKK